MPQVSEFFGIVIAMYFDEGGHAVPPFHAEHGDDVASVAFGGRSSLARCPHATLDCARVGARSPGPTSQQLGARPQWKPLESVSRCPKIFAMPAGRPKWIVRGVTVIGDHRLRLLFEDGTVGDISFEGRVWDGALTPLNDPAYFARVQIAHSSLSRPEGQIDLAPEPLYEAAATTAIARPVAAAT